MLTKSTDNNFTVTKRAVDGRVNPEVVTWTVIQLFSGALL